VRTVLPETINYSYTDGDQAFEWSPDGKWFAFHYPEKGRWMDEIGLVPATGGAQGGWRNLTQSGYEDYDARWSADGRAILYRTGRNGMRSHGAWGFQEDVYAVFPSRAGQEWYRLSEEEWAERQEADSLAKAAEEEKAEDKGKKKGGRKEEAAAGEDSVKVVFEPEGVEQRAMRLTTSSADLADYLLSQDGETLYTLARYAKGLDLYETKIRKRETKLLVPLDLERGHFLPGSTDKQLYLLGGGGRLMRIDLAKEAAEDVAASPEMTLRRDQEWQYFFDHIWRQVREKFYDPNLHGVDWEGLRAVYQRYLPAIDHPRDFAECMSELLGELNASHTGCFVRSVREDGDATAELGLLFDPAWTDAGLRIAEVLERGPCDRSESRIRAGQILLAVDGRAIAADEEAWPLLNRRAGEPVLLTLRDDKGKDFDELVKPLPSGGRWGLLYERWVKRNADEVERLSGGRLGYVHVASMDEGSFRRLYREALGRYADKEGLVVDSRFNGGGNLTQDLVAFFGGRRTFRNVVRPGPRVIGEDPWDEWNRPSIVIMNETNYSDAHCFPFAYKDNQEGRLVGMPVAGTGTSVWWEGLMDDETVFGIPEVGIETEAGRLLENQQLEPDIRVDNTPETVTTGRDLQLETAVRELLKELPKGPK
jgi:C-terminal processing protease CtpA/Prc